MNLTKALEVFAVSSLDELNIEDLKKKYRQLAKHKHPDKTGGGSDEFVELREAFILLLAELQKNGGSSKALRELSKEEILNKYYHDTQDLLIKIEGFQESFQSEMEILTSIRSRVEEIIKEFEQRKAHLQKELETKIAKLETSYTQNLIKRIFFFLPKMSEDEFWETYEKQVQKYSRKHADLDMEFFKQMLAAYGDGLNEISKVIAKN